MTQKTTGTANETFVKASPGDAVSAAPGDVVRLWMPEPDQCRAFGLPLWSGKMLWSITHPDGTATFYPADDVQVVAGLSG